MLKFKAGVRCRGVSTESVLALLVAMQVYDKYGYDCVVTSICDGIHSAGSRHYLGHAIDLRTRHLPDGLAMQISADIASTLSGLQDFDVMYEGHGTPNQHIHIQYKPKGP